MTCNMKYTVDEGGQELLLKDDKFQVMMEWEKPYMQACIDALVPKGDVLEIGFGLGYSATQIQAYQPKSHTIIEYHPIVAEKARLWAKQYENVTIIENTWQSALPMLGEFDEIFFDDYPLESESEMQVMKEKQKVANSLLKSGEKKMKWVHRLFPSLSKMQYDDAAIEDFFQLLEKKKSIKPSVYIRFFSDLKKKSQISEGQYQSALKKLLQDKLISSSDLNEEKPSSFRAPSERLFVCLEQCLQNHMRKGAKFSCYLNHDVSLYDNADFLKNVVNNPYLDFERKVIPVSVPAHCEYFQGTNAQVVVVRKVC